MKILRSIRTVLSWISNRPKGHDWIQITMRTNIFLDGANGVVVAPTYQCLKCKVTIASDGTDNLKCEPRPASSPWVLNTWHASVDQKIRSCEEEVKILAMEDAIE